jgi:hypothetical protein
LAVPTGRTIVKYSFFGFLAVVGALFLFISFVPERYWPISACNIETLNEAASPSKALVARHVRTNCESNRLGRSGVEATVFIGTTSKTPGQLVFFAPAYFYDGAGREQAVDLKMMWKSEDHLEISYPDEVAPILPGYEFRSDSFIVRVTSISKKMTSNPSLQSGPIPAAELTR